MTKSEFSNPCTQPCIKCGAIERDKRGRCKPCKNKEGVKYRASNLQKGREYAATRYATNPEKQKAASKKYAQANPEKIKAQVLAYVKENYEELRLKRQAHYAANTERQGIYHALWRIDNKEALRVIDHNYRARKMANGGRLSNGLQKKLFKLQKGLCACCREPLGDNYHLDHIQPLALGGPNEDSNIQLLRQRCNNQKGKKDPLDFMQQRGYLL